MKQQVVDKIVQEYEKIFDKVSKTVKPKSSIPIKFRWPFLRLSEGEERVIEYNAIPREVSETKTVKKYKGCLITADKRYFDYSHGPAPSLLESNVDLVIYA